MIEYPYDRDDVWVVCTCCGALVENEPGKNVSLNLPEGTSYPQDAGFGECVRCGGDPNADPDDFSEANVRRRQGWAGEIFFDSRIKTLKGALGEDNRAKFAAMDYATQCAIVTRYIEKGLMI